jgi:hypothetical protein
MNLSLITFNKEEKMKRKTFWVVTFSVILLLFCNTSISFAGQDLWPNREGELCWYVYTDDIDPDDVVPEEADGYLRLYVVNTGNNYYLVHGSNTEPYDEIPPNGTQLTNGNAIVYTDTILMHASSSGFDDDEVRGWLGTVELDPDTLHGKLQGVGINFDKNSPPSGNNGYVNFDGVQTLVYDPDCVPE